MKPNKTNIRKWIKALRSGKYKQGKHSLRSLDNKFCCLGVACDLYLKEHKIRWKQDKDDPKYLCNDEPGLLPSPVRIWLGLNNRDPIVKIIDKSSSVAKNILNLTIINDAWDWDFKQIADAIEAEYL